VYPVHALAFHPTLGTFATGGGDGYVNFWDGEARKRLAQVGRFPTSVSALAFSPNGAILAIASSYAHEDRENVKPRDVIYLRSVSEDEVRPKKSAA
jgi:FOG: WD40 repeat